MKKLKIPNCKFIQPHIFMRLNSGNSRNMPQLFVFGKIQVLQNGPGSDDPITDILYTKSFQGFGMEMI